MKKHIILRIIRWTILLSILILTTVLGRLHQVMKLYPSIDAFCPFGGLESAWAFIRYQGFLKRIGWSSFILLFTTIAIGLTFRRSFCGNICPLGFLQELFGLGGRRLLKRRFELPDKVDRILRYGKYIVLLVFLGLAWKTLALAIRPFDPWIAYHHIGSDELFSEYLIGTLILAGSLVVGFFMDRPFCRYLCPMGGFLALPSKIGITRIKRNASSCISCGKCNDICPAALDVAGADEMKSVECLSCSECINACPVENTLYYSAFSKKKLPAWLIPVGTLLILLVVLGVTTLTGTFVWKADSGLDKQVERLLWGPHKINNQNSLMDVVQVYQIHPAFFIQQFGLDKEEQFYQSLEELGIEAERVEVLVNTVYEEAGRDPRKVLGGGGCSGGH